ncbi:hypothetical protein [Candidatus Korarchaeum cryptofilum]|jgi:hypothetical protein|uniref:Uncharacterized protein n=1 Tax=Korarchaeum cryptofilum (strain OPF8) TaxID=374847 RepID=B1L3G3_KORCO|nr:hypothetical protein [Candidatus Korarchaeum cryptofilum]ACB06992.1 hypothetical protein Kcr_0232 [Candidatus Korarchaeum cryptofilum OPF8]
MKSRGSDGITLDSIIKALNDMGLDAHTKVSSLGSIIKIEIKFDPLERERRALNAYKASLRSSNQNRDISGQLIQQIDHFLKRVESTRMEKVLVAAPSQEGLRLLLDQVMRIGKEMIDKRREADELRKLIRLFLSYVREYARASDND